MRIVAFTPVHLEALALQSAQIGEARLLGARDYREELAVFGLSHSVFVEGRLVACAGVKPLWPGRAFGWAMIGRDFPRSAWLPFTRATLAVLERAHAEGHTRIETTVDAGFEPGVRWVADHLGFEVEGFMRGYLNGRDHLLYARVAPAADVEVAA